MASTLEGFCAVLRAGGKPAAQAWLTEQTARPLRPSDRALFDALEGFVSLAQEQPIDNPQRVPFSIYPFLIAASLSDSEIAAFYGEQPLPQWRLRFPVVLPGGDRITIEDVGGAVLSMALSPNGQRVAITSKRGGVRAWNTTGPTAIPVPADHLPCVLSIAWIDDDRLLLGAEDGFVHIWTVSAAAIEALPHTHTKTVRCVASDGERLVTCSDDGSTAYWPSATQAPLLLTGQTGRLTTCAVAGTCVITGTNSGEIGIWDMVDTGLSTSIQAHEGPVTTCAFVPGQRTAYTGGEDGQLIAWDIDHATPMFAISGDNGAICALAVDPAGQRALTGHHDNSIALSDLIHEDRLGLLLGHHRPVTGVAFSPTSGTVWTASRDRSIRSWHMNELRTPQVALHHTKSVRAIDFSPDHKWVASGSRDGSVVLWSVEDGRQMQVYAGPRGAIYDVRLSPSGDRIAAVTTRGRIIVWKTHTGETIQSITGNGEPVTCCVFLDEDTLITGGRDNQIHRWNIPSGEAELSLAGHTHWVRCLDISPDGMYLLSGSYDQTLRRWDLATGETTHVFEHHNRPVIGCAISADQGYAVSLGLDGALVQWRWSDAERLQVIEAHDGPGAGLALLGDHQAVTVGQDHWVRTFDLMTGAPVHQIPLTNSLDSVAIAPGLAAVGDRAGNLWLFDRATAD
jgi:WD40 repeat protein